MVIDANARLVGDAAAPSRGDQGKAPTTTGAAGAEQSYWRTSRSIRVARRDGPFRRRNAGARDTAQPTPRANVALSDNS